MSIYSFEQRKKIHKYVRKIKEYFKFEKKLCFPVLDFVENVLPNFYENYSFEIVDTDVLGNKHGETYPDLNLIQIRSDVYIRAINGYGRDRMTIAHEIGHLLLHKGLNIQNIDINSNDFTAYSEWEANVFAGELLASSYLIKNMTVEEISQKCMISKEAAAIQLKYS